MNSFQRPCEAPLFLGLPAGYAAGAAAGPEGGVDASRDAVGAGGAASVALSQLTRVTFATTLPSKRGTCAPCVNLYDSLLVLLASMSLKIMNYIMYCYCLLYV